MSRTPTGHPTPNSIPARKATSTVTQLQRQSGAIGLNEEKIYDSITVRSSLNRNEVDRRPEPLTNPNPTTTTQAKRPFRWKIPGTPQDYASKAKNSRAVMSEEYWPRVPRAQVQRGRPRGRPRGTTKDKFGKGGRRRNSPVAIGLGPGSIGPEPAKIAGGDKELAGRSDEGEKRHTLVAKLKVNPQAL